MMSKDITNETPISVKNMTEADWIMLVALFLAVWILMILRYWNI